MSGSMASLWAKTKTKAVQTKQMVNVKLGRAEETVDTTFEEEKTRFNEHYTKLKKLREDGRRMIRALQELSAAQTALFEDFLTLYPQDASVHAVVTKGREAASSAEAARMVFEQNMTKDFVDPITIYNGQFEEVKKRMTVRDNRKLDMDRYKFDLKSHQAKNNPKAAATEEKLNKASHNYDLLNTELCGDMPALYQDRGSFLEPIYSVFATSLASFYEVSSVSMGDAANFVRNTDRSNINSKLRVITPDATSWAYQAEKGSALAADYSPAVATPGETVTSTYVPSSSPPSSSVIPPSAPLAEPSAYVPPSDLAPAPPSGPQKGRPGIVLFNFEGQDETELTVKAGDRLTILEAEGEWWEAEHNGKRGLVPFNYLSFDS